MSLFRLHTDYYAENHVRYVFIDGNGCSSLKDCYATLRRQLSLPDYFGNNLDALEEVLEDLEWISEEKVKVIFLNRESLLKNDRKKEAFLDIFTAADNQKLEVIFLGPEA